MSCGCNNSNYSSSCCPEVPYPSISSESVPSLIDNLVYALYGTINKSISGGRVIWDIPCDPSTSPASVSGIPREDGEGLLCYIIRVLNEDVAVIPNVVDTVSTQTITGQKTFTQSILATGGVTGNVTGSASMNVLKAGDTMTGALVVPSGITANLIGNATGNAGTATTLQNARTIAISGAVTGTATSFNGSANITIPATISSGATITSPAFAGTATGSLISKVIQGVTDGSTASVGYIGEQLVGTSALATIGSNVIAQGATITLTPGSWDVFGNATFNFTGVTAAAGDIIGASISLANNTLVDGQQQVLMIPAISLITQIPAFAFVTPRIRFDITTNTTVYLNVLSPTTTAGTMQFSSIIRANRVR